jgi:hypothetical protein
VTHFGRTIPAHLDTALRERDPVCAVPGCGIDYGLERDHVIPFAEGGPTELDNLVRLCKRHHFLKTHRYWRLLGRPGAWRWVKVRDDQPMADEDDPCRPAAAGEPTAGLARPILPPPGWAAPGSGQVPTPELAEPKPDVVAGAEPAPAPGERFTQQSFGCTTGQTVLVLRLSSPDLSPSRPSSPGSSSSRASSSRPAALPPRHRALRARRRQGLASRPADGPRRPPPESRANQRSGCSDSALLLYSNGLPPCRRR